MVQSSVKAGIDDVERQIFGRAGILLDIACPACVLLAQTVRVGMMSGPGHRIRDGADAAPRPLWLRG